MKVSEIKSFASSFQSNCQSETCNGWWTFGKYKTLTNEQGNHQLRISIKVVGPESLSDQPIKVMWAVSSNNNGQETKDSKSEIFYCSWAPSLEKKWTCMYGVAYIPIKDWHVMPAVGGDKIKVKKISHSASEKNNNIVGREMKIYATRHFQRPNELADKLSVWKLGETKDFWVSFTQGSGTDKLKTSGRSDILKLELQEPVIEKVQLDIDEGLGLDDAEPQSNLLIILIPVLILLIIAGFLGSLWYRNRQQKLSKQVLSPRKPKKDSLKLIKENGGLHKKVMMDTFQLKEIQAIPLGQRWDMMPSSARPTISSQVLFKTKTNNTTEEQWNKQQNVQIDELEPTEGGSEIHHADVEHVGRTDELQQIEQDLTKTAEKFLKGEMKTQVENSSNISREEDTNNTQNVASNYLYLQRNINQEEDWDIASKKHRTTGMSSIWMPSEPKE